MQTEYFEFVIFKIKIEFKRKAQNTLSLKYNRFRLSVFYLSDCFLYLIEVTASFIECKVLSACKTINISQALKIMQYCEFNCHLYCFRMFIAEM